MKECWPARKHCLPPGSKIENGAPDCRIKYAAGFPAAQRCFGEAVGVSEEGQLINGAGHEAVPPVEIGETARSARIGLIVDAA